MYGTRGYRLVDVRLGDLLNSVANNQLTLPDDRVVVGDATPLVESILAGWSIGMVVVTSLLDGVIVDGAARLSALRAAFRRPAEGGLSITNPMSDSPGVTAQSHPDGRTLGEYLPLADTLHTLAFLRWQKAVKDETSVSQKDFYRCEGWASTIAGFTVPVVLLPQPNNAAEARAWYQRKL